MKETIFWISNEHSNIAITENEDIHKAQLEMLSSKKSILAWLNSGKTYWRKKTLEKFELFIGDEVFGNVLEIGAGTAWCSALLTKKKNVEKVNVLEFDMFSIQKLMPKIFDALDADIKKIQPILGSYDDIKFEDDQLDFIFGMGAMHHSQNLLQTYRELFRVLKPGGKILISDPAYPNNLSLEDEFKWRETRKPNGAKNKHNGDQKFRVCQWEAYALEAGFEINAFIFDETSIWRQLISNLIGDSFIKQKKTYHGFDKIVLYPYFGKINWKASLRSILNLNRYIPEHDKLMMILEKPAEHEYKALSESVYQ